MTKAEMIAYLKGRYESQSLKFPLLSRDVSLAKFIQANLPTMVRSDYWQSRDCACDVECRCAQHRDDV